VEFAGSGAGQPVYLTAVQLRVSDPEHLLRGGLPMS
jgi:hypothetical protein